MGTSGAAFGSVLNMILTDYTFLYGQYGSLLGSHGMNLNAISDDPFIRALKDVATTSAAPVLIGIGQESPPPSVAAIDTGVTAVAAALMNLNEAQPGEAAAAILGDTSDLNLMASSNANLLTNLWMQYKSDLS